MIEKSLYDVTGADLEALVTDRVSESRTLEYKRDLLLANDDSKRELARDVSSFANAAGGDLIYGVVEATDRDGKNLGYPEKLVGVESANFDALKLRFESIVRDNVDPRIPGIAFQKVEGFERGPVIIVRIPQSWIAPHMVSFQKQTHFYSRNNSGKHPLDVREIRSAFFGSSEQEQRVRRFRDERLGRLLSGETPVQLTPNLSIKVVTHVAPLSAEPLAPNLVGLRLDMRSPYARDGSAGRFTFDGCVSHPPWRGKDDAVHCYNQAFRNGAFESLTLANPLPARRTGSPERLLARKVEKYAHEAVTHFCGLQKKHSLECPLAVMVTLIGVKGLAITTGEPYDLQGEPDYPIDRDVLVLPEVRVEDTTQNIALALRPAFDAMWQAGGWERSFGYDEQGGWDARLHQ